jgi:hypothetical protein
MKYTDLAHVVIIHRFLNEYPWAAELPSLQSNIRSYNQGLSQLEGMCEDLLDARGNPVLLPNGKRRKNLSAMPFVKLIHGDSLDVAKREGVRVLLYVAWEVLRQTDTTLGSYTVPESYPSALNEFYSALDALDALQEVDESDSDDSHPGASSAGLPQNLLE